MKAGPHLIPINLLVDCCLLWSTPWMNLWIWRQNWEGAKQQYLLGKWLRQRYIDFLPTKYDADYIHIRSTDVDRTLMSAESNLAGLYPPVSNQRISKKLNWQPIPIHTIPESLDYLLAAKKLCPAYEEELIRFKNSPEMIDLDKINAELYAYLTYHTGRNISNVEDVEYLYNILLIEEKYNFTLPEWTKSVYPDKMKPLAELDFVVPTKTTLLKRLKSGPLLEEMVSNMKKKSENRLIPDRKMFVYSGHDTTVANFLNTLGVFDPQCPPYDALVLIELRQNSAGKYFVSVEYKNSTGEPIILTISGCQSFCPLESFIQLVKPLIPKHWEEECYDHEYFKDYKSFTFIALSAGLATCLLMLLMACLIYWQMQRSTHLISQIRAVFLLICIIIISWSLIF